MKSLISSRLPAVNFKLVLSLIAVSIACSFGADATTAAFNTSLNSTMDLVLPMVQKAVTVVLIIMFLAKGIPAFTGNNKEANWWELIGIIAGLVFVINIKTIYNAIVVGAGGTAL